MRIESSVDLVLGAEARVKVGMSRSCGAMKDKVCSVMDLF